MERNDAVNGKLVVLEGGEGCGKTTQLQRLSAWFEQKVNFPAVKTTREPGGSQLCQKIRQVLLTPDRDEEMQNRTELLLYAADRAQHVEGWLRPWLAEGALVLCDRYTASTVAYQGYGRGLDRALIDELNRIATGGLEADLTLWLDLDPEIGLARAQARGTRDRIEQADLKFHQNVRSGFAALHDAQKMTNPDRFIRIDASQSMDQVEQDLIQVFDRVLPDWLSA
jgi:dTMP kinase